MFSATNARSPSLQSAMMSPAVGLAVATFSMVVAKNLSRFQMPPRMTGRASRLRAVLSFSNSFRRSAETCSRLAAVAAERV